MATIYYPPETTPAKSYKKTIFLAGTIDNGNSKDWQKDLFDSISMLTVDIYNPRRPDWDSSWQQSIKNAQFKEQVTWELDNLEKADIIVINFEPKSQSPITLLELGYMIRDTSKKFFIRASQEFWRVGNIEILCERHNVEVYESIDELIFDLTEHIRLINN